MRPPLRWHHNATDLFNLWVVWRAYTIKVAGNLCSKISYADKLLQDVLGHDIGVTSFLHNVSNISVYDENHNTIDKLTK